MRTLEVNEVQYELRFSTKRIEIIENVIGKGVVALLGESRGYMPLAYLKIVFAYGLKKAGDNAYFDPKKGQEIALELIESADYGYTKLAEFVTVAISEDCPFLFPTA